MPADDALLSEGFTEEDISSGMQGLRPQVGCKQCTTATRAGWASTR
jgi:hypothetical protein